jgi:hypothetical protein
MAANERRLPPEGLDRDDEDRLQGRQCGRMLAAWVMDNGEKSKHLVKSRGLGHGAIL